MLQALLSPKSKFSSFYYYTLLIISCLWLSTAESHRMPGSYTSITALSDPQRIEVTHHIHTHDAEELIRQLLNDPKARIDSIEGQAQLALYVEGQFFIADADGEQPYEPMELTLVGAETNGDFILVYQEANGALPERIAVRNDILRDHFPGQVNQVNIEVDSAVSSLSFHNDDIWKIAAAN